MKLDDKLYGLEGWEWLETDISDAVDRAIDEGNDYPIRLLVFRRMDIPSAEWLGRRALEDLLETLHDEHANPECDPPPPTDAMIAAALALGEAIKAGYVSWACVPTGEVVEYTKAEADEDSSIDSSVAGR